MHHLHIDRYAGFQSPVHMLEPRLKVIAALAFILMVVLTPDQWFLSYGFYLLIVMGSMLVSRIPLGYFLKRSVLILPFAVAVSMFIPFSTPGRALLTFSLAGFPVSLTAEGIERFAALNAKALVSFGVTFLLVATTRFGDLMWAASRLGMPAKLVLVISFMYRYLFILLDKAAHMKLARDLRSIRGHRPSLLAASGNIIGALFVRSFAHATTLYDAMLLRGYTGTPVRIMHGHFHTHDFVATAGFLIVGAAACFGGGWYCG